MRTFNDVQNNDTDYFVTSLLQDRGRRDDGGSSHGMAEQLDVDNKRSVPRTLPNGTLDYSQQGLAIQSGQERSDKSWRESLVADYQKITLIPLSRLRWLSCLKSRTNQFVSLEKRINCSIALTVPSCIEGQHAELALALLLNFFR